MDSLNHHHLQCFWLVARRGGLAAAASALHVTPSTVWAGLKGLESALGRTLLVKRGRRLTLTEDGQRVAAIADELFALSQEIVAATRSSGSVTTRLRVGVVSSVPRFVAAQLLTPLFDRGQRLQLVEGSADALNAALAAGSLDAVLSDEARTGHARAQATLVATSDVGLFCGVALCERLQPGFPQSLDGAPFILPAFGSAQRASIDDALRKLGVRPHVLCEVDDSALSKALAASGRAVIAAPELVRNELLQYFSLRDLGALGTVASYYLLSARGAQRLSLSDLTPMVRRSAQ